MKFIVRFLAALLAISLVVAAGAFVFLAYFDANQYREEIEAAIEKFSGQAVRFHGPLDIDLFPDLRFTAEEVQVIDKTGMSKELLSAEKASASINILPLLEKKIQIGTVLLRAPKIHLISDKTGRSNWDMATAQLRETTTQEEADDASSPFSLSVRGIELSDAEIVWDDRQKRQYVHLKELHLRAESPAVNAPMDIRVRGEASYAQAEDDSMGMAFLAQGELRPDETFSQIELRDFSASLQIEHQKQLLPTLEILGGLSMDLDKGTAQITLQEAVMDELEIAADIHVSDAHRSPQWRAELNSNTFNPRSLAQALHIDLPSFSQDKTLSSLQIKGRWRASEQWIELEEVAARMDDSRIKLHGRVALSEEHDTVLYAHLDHLVLDPYLELNQDAKDQGRPTPEPEEGRADPAGEGMLALNSAAELQLEIDRLDWHTIHAESINGNIKATRQSLEVGISSANVFAGSIRANIKNDRREQWWFNVQSDDLAVHQIIEAVDEKNDLLRAYASVDFSGTASGMERQDILETLRGQIKLELNQAELANPKLQKAFGVIMSQIVKNEDTAKGKTGKQLFIESAKASFKLAQGVADNADLHVDSAAWTASGAGEIDYLKRRLDYTLKVKIKGYDRLPVIPIFIHGPFDDLSYMPGIKQVAAERATEIKKKIEEKIKPKVEELKETVEDRLKELLKF